MKKKLAHIPRFRKRCTKAHCLKKKFVFKWRSLIAHSLLQINIVRYISFSKWHYSSNKCPNILRQLLILMCFIFLGGWCLRASRLMAQCALLWIRGTRGGRRQQGQISRATDTQSTFPEESDSQPPLQRFLSSSGNKTSEAGLVSLVGVWSSDCSLDLIWSLFSRRSPYRNSSQDISYLQ